MSTLQRSAETEAWLYSGVFVKQFKKPGANFFFLASDFDGALKIFDKFNSISYVIFSFISVVV